MNKLYTLVRNAILCKAFPFLRIDYIEYDDCNSFYFYRICNNLNNRSLECESSAARIFYKACYQCVNFADKIIGKNIERLPWDTMLDCMPSGWRRCFGIQMCIEIRNALLDAGGKEMLHNYKILQIKEKYGELRWYDCGAPSDVSKIIEKYEYISARTCIVCGRPAEYITNGWISPYCKEHLPEHALSPSKFITDIDWYGYKEMKSKSEDNNELQ